MPTVCKDFDKIRAKPTLKIKSTNVSIINSFINPLPLRILSERNLIQTIK